MAPVTPMAECSAASQSRSHRSRRQYSVIACHQVAAFAPLEAPTNGTDRGVRDGLGEAANRIGGKPLERVGKDQDVAGRRSSRGVQRDRLAARRRRDHTPQTRRRAFQVLRGAARVDVQRHDHFEAVSGKVALQEVGDPCPNHVRALPAREQDGDERERRIGGPALHRPAAEHAHQ